METNVSSNQNAYNQTTEEDWVVTSANGILIVSLLFVFIAFMAMLCWNQWPSFLISLGVLLVCVAIWSVMRVLAKISKTLTEIKEKTLAQSLQCVDDREYSQPTT